MRKLSRSFSYSSAASFHSFRTSGDSTSLSWHSFSLSRAKARCPFFAFRLGVACALMNQSTWASMSAEPLSTGACTWAILMNSGVRSNLANCARTISLQASIS